MVLCAKINIVLRKGSLGRKGQVVMVTNASDNQKVRHREGSRKNKERDVSDPNSLGLSKTNQENQSGPIHEKGLKGSSDEDRAEHDILGHHSSKKQREDVSSNDEQLDSR